MYRRWPSFPDFAMELTRLRNEMDRAFGRPGEQIAGPAGFPAVNVWDDVENLYVEAELPGMALEDIEILVNGDNQLTIQGERKQPKSDEGTWHRKERGFGKFSRLIQLPSDVVSEKVAARYEDGVLVITMPKKEEAKPRRIAVKAGG